MLKVEAVINDFLEQILTFLFTKRPAVHCCSLNVARKNISKYFGKQLKKNSLLVTLQTRQSDSSLNYY